MKHTVSVLLSSVLAVGAITTAVFAQQPKLPPPDDWHAMGAIFRHTRVMVLSCYRKTSMNGFMLARL
jgi:hypothetical protein